MVIQWAIFSPVVWIVLFSLWIKCITLNYSSFMNKDPSAVNAVLLLLKKIIKSALWEQMVYFFHFIFMLILLANSNKTEEKQNWQNFLLLLHVKDARIFSPLATGASQKTVDTQKLNTCTHHAWVHKLVHFAYTFNRCTLHLTLFHAWYLFSFGHWSWHWSNLWLMQNKIKQLNLPC